MAADYLLLSSFLTAVLAGVWILVFAVSSERKVSRRLIGSYIAIAAFREVLMYLVISGRLAPTNAGVLLPIYLGSITLIYLYFCSLTDSEFALSKFSRLHLLPVSIGLVWWIYWHVSGPVFSEDIYTEVYAFACLLVATSAAYLILIHHQFKRILCNAKLCNSTLLGLRVPWLKFVLIVCYASVGSSALNLVTGYHIPFWFFQSLSFSVGMVGLTYFGLRCSKFLLEEEKPLAKPAYTPGEGDFLANKVMKFLRTEHPYLKPQYRLAELAEALNLKSYVVSEVINRGLKTNFYDLINGLRIEKAKSMMVDPAFSHMNLLGIAHDCGFNSKSSFNECFLRFTGATPSQYRAQMSRQQHRQTPGLA